MKQILFLLLICCTELSAQQTASSDITQLPNSNFQLSEGSFIMTLYPDGDKAKDLTVYSYLSKQNILVINEMEFPVDNIKTFKCCGHIWMEITVGNVEYTFVRGTCLNDFLRQKDLTTGETNFFAY